MTHHPNQATLVMTSTITPPTRMDGVAKSDPNERMKEYCQALEFYLNVADDCIKNIVFLENSYTDLGPLHAVVAAARSQKEVKFVSTSNEYPAEMGKGYGEFLMIDQGLKKATETCIINVFWKVTGRLIVRNLESIIRNAPTDYEIYCDLRHVPVIGETLGGNNWMDLRLFSSTMHAYDKYFRGNYNSGYVLEKEFYNILMKHPDQIWKSIIPRLKQQPELVGYSGRSGANYQGLSYKSKQLLRQMARSFIPCLWI